MRLPLYHEVTKILRFLTLLDQPLAGQGIIDRSHDLQIGTYAPGLPPLIENHMVSIRILP